MTNKRFRRPWLVATLAAVGALAVGGAALALFPPGHRTVAAESHSETPVDAALPSGSAPPSTMPSLAPEPGLTTGDRPGTTKVKPAATTKSTRTAPPAPRKPLPGAAAPQTSVSYQEGVRPGEPCGPRDAVGHTADGTLLTCGSPAAGDQDRWLVVIPPPPLK